MNACAPLPSDRCAPLMRHGSTTLQPAVESSGELYVDFDSSSGEEEFVVTNIDPFSVKNILLDEVARIEKECGLV
jgi:hypothetical protein